MIKALDKNSIHQICSGQVIVDLATAVKELVENALDANSSVIEVKLKNMGIDSIEVNIIDVQNPTCMFIQVSDNGLGINPKDYSGLAIKHCTSKLYEFSGSHILYILQYHNNYMIRSI